MPIYNCVIFFYYWLIKIASVKNEKAKHWVQGRKHWKQILTEKINSLDSGTRVWMHCASYGEFEQGRPLLEAIRKKHPQHKIILSFFSPSGYHPFKNWQGADIVCYLPIDTKKNARDFLQIVKPQSVIFIKYEFWLHFLFQLKRNQTPAYLVSAVFKPHHPFFRWYGQIFRRSLQSFSEIFVQDEMSRKLLEGINIARVSVSGDTRFDRVMEVKNNFKPLELFESFSKGNQILMGGSTWPKDDELLVSVFNKLKRPGLKLILVPHQVDAQNISELEKLLSKHGLRYCLYSSPRFDENTQVLVVNTIGLLSRLYHYSTIAYIGGGFNSGIHNCLEPAVYFKPIIFYGGSDHHKYNEAVDLLNLKAAKNITGENDLELALSEFLNNDVELNGISQRLSQYFERNSGSTEKVMEKLKL